MNTYVTNSAGLHRFLDPEDNRIYFYTHLEPFFAHRWFPCFDQPSIRAAISLSVVVPDASWKVYANGSKIESEVKIDDFLKQNGFSDVSKG